MKLSNGLDQTVNAASLITNGSFEGWASGNFAHRPESFPAVNDTMVLAPGSTTMTGWTVVNGDVAWIGPTNPFNLTASKGSYFLDLTGYIAISRVGMGE